MNLQTAVITVTSSVFIIYGLAFSVFPNLMLVLVTGAELQGASAAIDIRATYGGMSIAVGVIIYNLYRLNQIHSSLIAIIIVLVCMAMTRTVGLIVDGHANPLMYLYLVLEIAGVIVALLALRRGPGKN